MSRYIRLLNAIKSNLGALALTPGQAACRERIEERLAYPGVVNLFGLSGVGKTVLGWAMANEHNAVYLVHPNQWEQVDLKAAPILFIDNAQPERGPFRKLLGLAESAYVERVVIATRSPIDDYVYRAELNLADEDLSVVRSNLTQLGYSLKGQDYSNLWHLLIQTAKEGP